MNWESQCRTKLKHRIILYYVLNPWSHCFSQVSGRQSWMWPRRNIPEYAHLSSAGKPDNSLMYRQYSHLSVYFSRFLPSACPYIHICLSVCPSVFSLSIHLSVWLSLIRHFLHSHNCLYVRLSVYHLHTCIYLYVSLSGYPSPVTFTSGIQSAYPSVYYLSVLTFTHLPVCLSVCLYISHFVNCHTHICLSVCLFHLCCPYIHTSACWSICPSVHLSVCLQSDCPYIHTYAWR